MTIGSKPQKSSEASPLKSSKYFETIPSEEKSASEAIACTQSTPLLIKMIFSMSKAAYINTFIAMLNKILRNHGLNTIRAGIGLATGHDHIIKAGRKGVGINSTVWIGDAVAKASKLSSYGDKNGISRIVMNSIFYSNLADVYKNKCPEKDFESWYSANSSLPYFGSRHGSVIISGMNDWVNSGMID